MPQPRYSSALDKAKSRLRNVFAGSGTPMYTAGTGETPEDQSMYGIASGYQQLGPHDIMFGDFHLPVSGVDPGQPSIDVLRRMDEEAARAQAERQMRMSRSKK